MRKMAMLAGPAHGDAMKAPADRVKTSRTPAARPPRLITDDLWAIGRVTSGAL
jgi:hypothetical protein